MASQREHRRRIHIDDGMGSVMSAGVWWREGHFDSEEEARGAFKLAYQQGMDGMSSSVAAWMGLTEAEFDAWMRHGSLPPR